MTAETTPPLVPMLRFPEFRHAPGWRQSRLGSEAEFFKGRGVSKAEIDPNGNRACIRYGELYTRYGEVIDTVYSRTSAAESGLFLSRQNDVIVPASGETKDDIATVSCVMLDGVALGSDLNVIRTAHNGVFLSYLLNGTKRKEIAKVAQGDTVVHLYPSQLDQVTLALPSPLEQQKIADCLTSLDDLIAAEFRTLDALRRHKQGLMQQLFPRPGETVPRLRFPEFRDMSGWIADRFSNLYTFQRNNTLSRDKLNYKGGPAKNVHYGDIHTKFRTHFDITREAVPYINQGEAVPEADSEDYCVEGDLIFADASEDTNDVGKCIEVVELNGERLLSGQHTILARRSDNRLAVGFGGYLMRSTPIRTQIEKEAQGTKVYAISAARLGIIEVPFPPEQPEQEKIVDCLASIDAIIDAQRERLDSLQSHKQGLMQQLFPRPKEEAR
jgi:type I restriction enzyme S subunit